MNIKSVNTANQGVSNLKAKDLEKNYKKDYSGEQTVSSAKSDKLELSDEARKIQPIRQKISSGEYNKPEVYNALAARLNELLAPDKL